ncbi:OprD family outer membrane porin [Paraburkholderia sediminicola]|uniref:OprD family outer membrane porin n=1 Tax=Paraburkholderia sediminicola TaxID=458836 RepID=UPI0038B6F58E
MMKNFLSGKLVSLIYLVSLSAICLCPTATRAQVVDATPAEASSSTAASTGSKTARKAADTAAATAVEKKATQSGDTHGNAVSPSQPDAAAEAAPVASVAPGGNDVNNLRDMIAEGQFFGNVRTFYYASRNAFFSAGANQNTVSYGGELGYNTARFYGFSVGVSGYLQRGIGHSDNPDRVDSYLGPNITTLGEAYLKWEHDQFQITAGNQALNVPFASSYDWRISPQLYQGLDAKYGDNDNYITAFKMFRFKSYTDNSFSEKTTYNVSFDPYSTIGNTETSGFWGVGAAHKFNLDPLAVTAQGWYQTYQDYADLSYVEGQISRAAGSWKPFAGAQYFHETGDGRELLGHVDSQVYGMQLGVKHNSMTLSLGYDFVAPHRNSYLNGALVTPYAHDVSGGPLFAQPFLTSTQDLGSGSAYAIDINGAPMGNWFIGARYSFMDLKADADGPSLDGSEYLAYAIYNFDGRLKGLSVADFFAVQTSPVKGRSFVQNRFQLQYAWGPQLP